MDYFLRPRYESDADYTTNAPSYYDELARKNKLIEELVKKIWEYDKELAKRFEEWDKNLEELPEELKQLLIKWLDDGTLEEIINENIFNTLNTKINDYPINIKLFEESKTVDEQGREDWSLPFQLASAINKSVFIPEIDNFYLKDIELSSNTTVYGIKGRTVINGFQHTDVGKYTDTIFTANNKKNIRFYDIIFDGNTLTGGYTFTADKSKVKNLLFFYNTENIIFENCDFKHFVSNVLEVGAREARLAYDWHIMVFDYCRDVDLLNCGLYNSRLEGISGYKTTNFNVENFRSINTEISTPLHAWYCDGFQLTNPYIIEDFNRGSNAGSTLNIYSKNVYIEGGYLEGGTALDLGNEAEDPTEKSFVAENITISNIKIKGCINAVGAKIDSQLCKNVLIDHVDIEAIDYDGVKDFPRGISVGNVDGLTIRDSKIYGGTVQIRLGNDVCKNVLIANNQLLNGLEGIYITPRSYEDYQNFVIKDNIFVGKNETYQPTGTINGSGAFIYFSNRESTKSVDRIVIENNNVRSNGSWVIISKFNKDIESLIIKDNYFNSTESGKTNDRALRLFNIKNIFIENNAFNNQATAHRLSDCVNVTYLHNRNISPNADNEIVFSETTKILPATLNKVIIRDNKTDINLNHYAWYRNANMVGDIYVSDENNNGGFYTLGGLHSDKKGSDTKRPTNVSVGHVFFSITLNKPIYWNGTEWVDSTGTVV